MLICGLLLVGILFLSRSLGQILEESTQQRYARSVVNMDDLLKMEVDLALNLEKYAIRLFQKAKTIRLGIHQMKERHQKYGASSKFGISPFDTYSLIRHMQADWLMWQVFLEEAVGLELAYLELKKSTLPRKYDMFDAADGIRSMQATYEMLASDITNGLLDGVQYNSSLGSVDCLAMGHHLINQSRWTVAEQWILAGIEAKNPQTEMQLLRGPNTAHLFRILSQVRTQQGNHEGALQAYQIALKHSPHDSKTFQEYQSLEKTIFTFPGNNVEESKYSDDSVDTDDSDDNVQLPPCCSGRCKVPRELKKLYCVFNHVTAPFLRLAPIKTEILSIDPFVIILHEMVSPKENALIRSISKQYMLPSATVDVDETSDNYNIATFRTSKSVWYHNDFNEATLKITERLGDATGLDLNYAEAFQTINYGLAGFFQTHYDMLHSDKNRHNGNDDRVATTLFYLNEVPQGGGTYFPGLNITVFPKSGSALFWYNLDTKGNDQVRTLHTGCPVIVGSKWVVSKWVNYKGQEFRRPCIESNSNAKQFLSIERLII
ncbi:prolyl 4-hydroxylase subunit alpha-2-like isoform X2 [Drosophila gunungcola]|uniref:prolyl 4-hydroxylase subunit alpha-2-like isoform X2 n=1 Tax=Drosophila gunungcola TaxID=103775 RepID=UPI0022DEB621|nr:prolyl 4-hydroxylase subunit alpha-2-like isoform X2 [Drosophila gunungcola]